MRGLSGEGVLFWLLSIIFVVSWVILLEVLVAQVGLNFFGRRSRVVRRLVVASLAYAYECEAADSLEGLRAVNLLFAAAVVVLHRGTKKEKKAFLDTVVLLDLKGRDESVSLFMTVKLAGLLSSQQFHGVIKEIDVDPDSGGLIFDMQESKIESLVRGLLAVYDCEQFLARYDARLILLRKECRQLLRERSACENERDLMECEELVCALVERAYHALDDILVEKCAKGVRLS